MPDTPTEPVPAAPAQARLAGRSPWAVAFFVAIVVLTLAADLGLKQWSFNNVAGQPIDLTPEIATDHHLFAATYPHGPMVVIPRVLNLQLTTNTGAVFGMGKGNRTLFILVSVIATGVIGTLFYRSPAGSWVLHGSLGLILAGALGNLYDRVIYRAVRDMLHMLPGVDLPFSLSWPGGVSEVWPWIFNLADVALMVGVGLVLIATWRAESRAKSATQPTPDAESAPD